MNDRLLRGSERNGLVATVTAPTFRVMQKKMVLSPSYQFRWLQAVSMDGFSNLRQDGNHFPAELTSSRRQLMKRANWLVVATLVVLSGMAAAQLNSRSKIVTQVPFEFMVANKVVPAGEWVVRIITVDGNILDISNAKTNSGVFSPSSQTEAKQTASHCALVFNQYGDRYFLSGIKLQGSKIAYRLPESKAEAELRAQNVSPTVETLIASLE
ncbi:MAG: hypothetical protein ABSA80_13665 [Terriglobales bacterium]|jgi:hypothetical protein